MAAIGGDPLFLLRALGVAAALACATPAQSQGQACQIAQAEFAAHERRASRGGGRAQTDIDALTAQYYASGCDRPSLPYFSARQSQCALIERRIARAQAASSGGDADMLRRDRLLAAIETHCSPASALSATSRGLEGSIGGRSRVFIDAVEQPPLEDEQRPLQLGRAMCVRTCDGFYFPLTNSPNGREGADEMCQALCPASQTRAFFLDNGGVDQATNSEGQRYATLRNAYRFRREVSASCGCKAPGQTWSKALQRAEEMIQPGNDDIVVSDEKNQQLFNAPLRPGASARTPQTTAKIGPQQAIDPEPLDDGMLEPDPVRPDPPPGIVVLTPKPPPPPPAAVTPPPRDPKKPVRVVGPGVNADSGRPAPLAKPE